MTPAQCRAARGFLNWRIRDLAEHAGCHYNTVAYFENGSTQPGPQMVEALRKALEGQDIRFVGNTGIKAISLAVRHAEQHMPRGTSATRATA